MCVACAWLCARTDGQSGAHTTEYRGGGASMCVSAWHVRGSARARRARAPPFEVASNVRGDEEEVEVEALIVLACVEVPAGTGK